ncbi:MAG: sugar isomerase domain-containing protein [Granulosicoccus sp.]
MSDTHLISADKLCSDYLERVIELMQNTQSAEKDNFEAAATLIAENIMLDRLVHIFGPGGHSNLAAQEVFFRAGGLMHMNAILDEGTLLSNGALRSMAMERTPGYGRLVIENQNLSSNDLLILVNAYGINAALIDAAITAREKGVKLIGISSRTHADNTSADHPARHPGKQNLHDLVDVAIDTKVPVGDAVISIPGVSENTSAVSTFANAMALNTLIIRTIVKLRNAGVEPPIWRSGNAPGGDEANGRFLDRFRGRVRAL